jgi:hypothetical protein
MRSDGPDIRTRLYLETATHPNIFGFRDKEKEQFTRFVELFQFGQNHP